jgi:hypothetical protein
VWVDHSWSVSEGLATGGPTRGTGIRTSPISGKLWRGAIETPSSPASFRITSTWSIVGRATVKCWSCLAHASGTVSARQVNEMCCLRSRSAPKEDAAILELANRAADLLDKQPTSEKR